MTEQCASGQGLEPADRWVFAGLLALLVWAPLPLGSNRTWAIGILLGLALLGLLVALSLRTALTVLARRRSNLPRGMAFGVAMSIVALLVHSSVDFNLQIPANALTMVVVLAMGWVAARLPTAGRRTRLRPGLDS